MPDTTNFATIGADARSADPILEVARRLTVEAIGTFFLVFAVGATARSGTVLAPLAAGVVLMVMVYAGEHISGGHYNPAVTFAVLIRGGIRTGAACAYWLTQVMAGLVAALAVPVVVGSHSPGHIDPTGRVLTDCVAVEFLFTFALAYVVLNVTAGGSRSQFQGLAIGSTVAAGAIIVGGLSGGAFNPAVVLGAITLNLFAPATLLYVPAQLAGAGAAGLVFRWLHPHDT
ncbi:MULTISPECIES: aquaporin [Nocardia]|uniref:Aquaporin Z n=1 Tax=Nocardia cerradoensis TaxID=85688 RepID=A0A231GZ49_9NOCA|nr:MULTISPECIES: aquaporin [Nocardia]OXR41868.1 Aquaporin Z [Nocardia cerradoensis]